MLWAYWPTLGAGLIYEDHYLVTDPTWASVIAGWQTPQPVILSFLVLPLALAHAGNVALHLINGLLFYAIAKRLLPIWWAVTFTAIFWLHPIQTEAVAYLAGRGELFVAFAALLSLYALLFVRGWWAVCVVACACLFGIASKLSTGASLLLWLPLVGLWVGRWRWLWAVETLCLTGAAFAAPVASVGWMARQASAVWHLARLVIYPVGLSLETPPAVWPWLALGALLLALGAAIHSPRGRLSALWVTAGLLPRMIVQQPAPLIPGPFHEHHVYTLLLALLFFGGAWRHA